MNIVGNDGNSQLLIVAFRLSKEEEITLSIMRTLALILCVVFNAAFVHAQNFKYSFKESYEVATPAKLDLTSFDGELEVTTGSGNKIEVYYIVRKQGQFIAMDRATLEEKIVLETDNGSNYVSILVKDKPEKNFANRNRISVAFKVYVPKYTECILTTSDGDVKIGGLTGNQQIKTSDGKINVSNISGNIFGKTSDGDIGINDIAGDVEIKTSDGNIHIQDVDGNLLATTSDGNISINKLKGDVSVRTSDGFIEFNDVTGSFSGSTSDGNINGSFASLKKSLNLKTSDGNIDVTIPGQLGLDLDIRGESINAPLQNFSGKAEKDRIQGKSNGGGIPVILSTSGGRVKIVY